MRRLGVAKAGLRLVGAPGVAVICGLEECAMAGKFMLESYYISREYVSMSTGPHCVGGLGGRGTLEKSGLKPHNGRIVSGHSLVQGMKVFSTKSCQIRERHCPETIRHACEGTCWNCGKTPEDYFLCGNCGIIQPPDEKVDAFKIFDHDKPVFDIDVDDLESRYKNLQRSLHPDKFSMATEAEKELSADQATAVNHAYSILRRPLSRANYLLDLHGYCSSEERTITDPGMLEAVMEYREEVEETSDHDALHKLKESIEVKIDDCIQELKMLFKGEEYEQACDKTTGLRYLTRIHEAIVHKL